MSERSSGRSGGNSHIDVGVDRYVIAGGVIGLVIVL